jgi:uncharacterized protein YbjT (DUF2867 family)
MHSIGFAARTRCLHWATPLALLSRTPYVSCMNILVIGGSAGTGALSVQEALARGHHATVFSRNPQNFKAEHPHLARVTGDFHIAEGVRKAVEGHDAVIVTAAGRGLRTYSDNRGYFTDGTRNVIEAMKDLGPRRLVILSAYGVAESRAANPFYVRWVVFDWIIKYPYADHERQEALVRQSGLDWVIARPSLLTDGPAKGKSVRAPGDKPVPNRISRADVAKFLIDACESNAWVKQAINLGG